MAVISDTTMASLAALGAKLALSDDCLIKRNTGGSADGYGTRTEALATIGTEKCTLSPLSQTEGARLSPHADKLGGLVSWLVSLIPATVAQVGDTLTIKGQSMQLQAFLAPRSFEIFRIGLASEVKP